METFGCLHLKCSIFGGEFQGYRNLLKQYLHSGLSISSRVVDEKLDLMVGELQRYDISVAGIQKTK